MSSLVPISFAAQAYESRSLPAAAQRLVNMYAEALPDGANGPLVLLPTPGLKPWSTVGDGPCRGLHVMGGNIYVVSGDELIAVDANKNEIAVGAVTGLRDVRMANNGTHVAICTDSTAYAANTSGITALAQSGLNGVDVQDGYGIFTKAGTNEFYITALDDMLTIDPLDFSTVDVQADTLMGCISDHRDLWLFKERTIEIWNNVGIASFPFQRAPAGFLEVGCAAPGSIANTGHRVLWLGNDADGGLAVYASQGYSPQRISTPAIEKIIAEEDSPVSCQAFAYAQAGHTHYAMNFDEATITYDLTTGRWHERVTYDETRWRANHYAYFAGKHLVGDFETGAIYELDLDTYEDNSDGGQRRVLTSHVVDGGERRISMDELILNCETGVGSDDGSDHENPQVTLEWSDDGGRSWSAPRLAALGAVGNYSTRPRFTRLGSFYRRILRLGFRAPNKFVVMGATARIGGGL